MNTDDAGYRVIPPTKAGMGWAQAARALGAEITARPDLRSQNLRHGETWFVGVDMLPNAPDGALGQVPFEDGWRAGQPDLPLHRAQLSVMYPGYPGRDGHETEAAHIYRRDRCAAHVDGLLPVGPARRRYAMEFHAYILGVPLSGQDCAPTVVWPGSHKILHAALRDEIGDRPADQVDVTDAYHAARRMVLDQIEPVPLRVPLGGAFWLHRFALHGTAPWSGSAGPARMTAFFRPAFASPALWLAR